MDDIDLICKKYFIYNYLINSDGSIDVDSNVYIIKNDLIKLPIRFGKVSGNFDVSYNNLTSLEGFPIEVGGNFNCSHNQLISLEGCTIKVGGSFDCSNNNLTSLEGCPKKVVNFNCSHNQLISLGGCPIDVGGDFNCCDNKITSLVGCSYSNNLYCGRNPVFRIWCLFALRGNKFLDKINHIYIDLHLDCWTIQGDVLEQIYEEIYNDIELPPNLAIFIKDRLERVGYKVIGF